MFVQTARVKPCAPSRPCGRYNGGLAPAHTFSSQREQRETATPRHVLPRLPPGMPPTPPGSPPPPHVPSPTPGLLPNAWLWCRCHHLTEMALSPQQSGLVSEALCVTCPTKSSLFQLQFPQNLEQVTSSSIPAAQGQAEPWSWVQLDPPHRKASRTLSQDACFHFQQ